MNRNITATFRKAGDHTSYDLPSEFRPFFRANSPTDFDGFLFLCNLAAEKLGFSLAVSSHRREFCCKQSTVLNTAAILPETKYISLSDWNLSRKMYAEDPYYYSGVGIVRNGKLLSWCAENSHWLPEDETEIGVWTDPEFQRLGFATSNVVYLCSQLQKRGMGRILYSADVENAASI